MNEHTVTMLGWMIIVIDLWLGAMLVFFLAMASRRKKNELGREN